MVLRRGCRELGDELIEGPEYRAASTLGPIDEVPYPQSGGGDEDEAEVAIGGLVVPGRQSAAVPEL